jgi:hypothetical protein
VNPLPISVVLAVVLLHLPPTIHAAASFAAAFPENVPAPGHELPDRRAELDDFPDGGDSLATPAGPAAVASAAVLPVVGAPVPPGSAAGPDPAGLLLAGLGFVGTVAVRRLQRSATT